MRRSVWRSVLNLISHGYGLAEADRHRRHRLLLLVLAVHVPGLAAIGLLSRRPPDAVLLAAAVLAGCLLLVACVGTALSRREQRAPSVVDTAVPARPYVTPQPPDGRGGAHRLRLDGDDTLRDSSGVDSWGADRRAPHGPVVSGPVVPRQRSETVWFGDDAGQYIGVRRRAPRSHLVPELGAHGAARPALPPGHVTGAAQALSRLHARRRAASDRSDGAPEPRPGDGVGAGAAWFEPAPSDAEPGAAR